MSELLGYRVTAAVAVHFALLIRLWGASLKDAW
jgi:hypothetical protein